MSWILTDGEEGKWQAIPGNQDSRSYFMTMWETVNYEKNLHLKPRQLITSGILSVGTDLKELGAMPTSCGDSNTITCNLNYTFYT